MTPEEQEQLAISGIDTFYNSLNIIVGSVGYGALVLMTYIALHSLGIKAQKHSRNALIACCIAVLFLFTIIWLYTSAIALLVVARAVGSIANNPGLNEEVIWEYMNIVAQAFIVIIGDSIVVWRVWVLLPDSRIWKVLLTVLQLANIGCVISDCIVDIISTQQELNGFDTKLDWVADATTFFVNILGTIFIMCRWWTYKRSLNTVYFRNNSQVQKIFLVFIESGAIFCAAQAIVLAFNLTATFGSSFSESFRRAAHVFLPLFTVATALYPPAVIILVNENISPIVETIHYNESIQRGITSQNDIVTII
ncbi:hypothetical protein GYMLUDRAFT_35396 [Collybiopsis luxurians FD-317 M1]|nr:hypothetical protein GYMLUDRAFT_35396 [Collybiopsis luxurians FD-317 M1]